MASTSTLVTPSSIGIVPRTFGLWEVTAEGLRGWFGDAYWYRIDRERLGERWACHLSQKRESVRGPLADLEAAIQAAREFHGVKPDGFPCYCGRHRDDSEASARTDAGRGGRGA